MGARRAFDRIAGDDHRQRAVAQRAPAGAGGVRREGPDRPCGRAAPAARGVRAAERAAQALARDVDRVGIDVDADFARQIRLARQRQRQRREGVIDAALDRVLEDRAIGGDERGGARRRAARADRGDRAGSAAASPGSATPASG